MGSVFIGDCLGEGLGLIRRRPVAVLTWGLIQTLVTSGAFTIMAPLYQAFFAQIASAGKTGGAPPDIGAMMHFQSVSWLISIGNYAVAVVLYCAVFRSVLYPEQRRFAYLRLGAAEFFLFIVVIMALLGFGAAIFALFIPVFIVAGIGMVTHAAYLGVMLGIVGSLAAIAALIYLALRFSLVGPMTVQEGKFVLLESWRLTRGKVGSLFLLALCIVAILFVGEVIIGAVLILIGAGALSSAAGGLGNLAAFFRQPLAEILSGLAPFLVGLAVVWIPFSGCALALMGAPWARAYRDLVGPDLAATFS